MSLTSDEQARVDRIDQARTAQAAAGEYVSRPGPVPVDPATVAVRVVACTVGGCRNGRQPLDPADPDDTGIRGCCEGYGVRLDVPPGLEPLVLALAARAAGGWAWENRADPTAFSGSWVDSITDAMADHLAYRPPHAHGAGVAPGWPGSPEEARELAVLPLAGPTAPDA
jgi:hypothetical protein